MQKKFDVHLKGIIKLNSIKLTTFAASIKIQNFPLRILFLHLNKKKSFLHSRCKECAVHTFSRLKYFNKLLLIFLLLSFATGSVAFAQDWEMPVDGKVFASNEKLTGSVVTLYKNGQQIQQVVTTSNGKFSFILPPNAEYIISVTKPGYITKKFKINTANVPVDRVDAGNFNPFEPDVTLFEMPTAPEIAKRVEAILSQPVAIYQFIPSEGNFNYDEKYTQVIQDRLAELAQLQKQAEKQMQEKAKTMALDAQKQLELDNQYKAVVAKGDGALGAKDYASAKTNYSEALKIKPGEAYPKQKLGEISKLMADGGKQKEIDEKYKAAIAVGDGAFGAKDYAAAKKGYSEASSIKPGEVYPKTKLAEVEKLLTNAGKQKEIDEKYKTAIAKADGAFGSKDYSTAKADYTEAAGIKPGEAYPKTKLAEIEKLITAIASQKSAAETEQKYKDAVAKADAEFSKKEYTGAKGSYTLAAAIKPAEQYPKTKIAEIDKLLAELALKKSTGERDQQYKDALSKADKFFASKDYANSKSAYSEALDIKPGEQYPKTKIEEINKLFSAAEMQNQKELRYKELIVKADGEFLAKDYISSKTSYSEAISIKADPYPKAKIAEIDRLLTALAALQANSKTEENYKAALVRADNFFKEKNYVNARSVYTEALTHKPNEQYPKDKIAEIGKIENAAREQGESEALYNEAIVKADNLFKLKNYSLAKNTYEEALTHKPNEKYPKERIKIIDQLLLS